MLINCIVTRQHFFPHWELIKDRNIQLCEMEMGCTSKVKCRRCRYFFFLNIPHFQPLLSCVVISLHDVRKYLPEVVVVDWMCASFNFEVKCQPFEQSR